MIEHAGRLFAILLPPLVAEIGFGHDSVARALVLSAILAATWYCSIEAALVANRTTLAVIGPRLPALCGAVLGLVITTALGVWFPALALPVATSLIVAAAITVAVVGWESVFVRWLAPRTRLLLVGPVQACTNVLHELASPVGRHFQLVGIVDDGEPQARNGALVVGTTAQLPAIISRLRPDLVSLVPGCKRPAVFTQLADSAEAGFRVLELAQFYEYAFGRVPVRDLPRAWFMSVLHLYQRPYAQATKRASDILGASFLLVVTAPLLPVITILVLCTRGPLLIRQTRVGEHGRVFTMYKFRSMRADAEAPGEAVWAQAHDPRVTAAGRVLRRLRLDELPQLWNVLKGDMSIVGPRPERPEFIDELFEDVPHWGRRHLVRPGITGWAQVRRGYTADTLGSLQKLSYDLWYIRHRSLVVDIAICTRTLAAVVRGDREVTVPAAESLNPIDLLAPIEPEVWQPSP